LSFSIKEETRESVNNAINVDVDYHSEFLLLEPLFNEFQTAVVIVGKVMYLVLLEETLHDIEKLLLP